MADSHMAIQIDKKEYDEAQLVEIRVDLNMPYQERFTEFERHYGEITIDGKWYTYVMRKVEGNVLILKCIPNQSKQFILNTSDALTQANTNPEQQNNAQQQNSMFAKVLKIDFINNSNFTATSFNPFIKNSIHTLYTETISEVSILPPQQPPRC